MLILFDCDGVLVDSEMIANRVMAAHLSAHGYPITGAQARQRFIGRTIAKVMEMVRDAGVDLPDDFEATLRQKDEVAFARELEPVRGVVNALKRLDGRPKAVASSGSMAKIERNLEITGLRNYFGPYLFSAAMVANPKPAPDLFLFAAREMNVAPADCWVIEDTPLGVEAAQRAGMRAAGFCGASHATPDLGDTLRRAGAEVVFDDMARMPGILR